MTSVLEQAAPAEAALLAKLRAGDELAYRTLVTQHSAQMLHVAMQYARSRAVAEEALQETWLAVLEGLDGFQGRASLKTWIFRILVNKARDRGVREQRVLPLTEVLGRGDRGSGESGSGESGSRGESGAEGAERLRRSAAEHSPGHWTTPAGRSTRRPDDAALEEELMARLSDVIDHLPEVQGAVLVLRDVEGWSAEDVCARLGLRPGNQRVVLHRARTAVRRGMGPYLAAEPA